VAALLWISGCGGAKGAADASMSGSDGGDDAGVGDDLAVGDMATLPPDLTPPVMTVLGTTNVLALDACAVTPATFPSLPANTYTITLSASTLSKGQLPNSAPPVNFVDNYVIVQLPLAAGDTQEAHRFFMLNGVGASSTFTLPATGTVNVMFIDSDDTANSGTATVNVEPGGYMTTVDAALNVLRWKAGCNSTPAGVYVSSQSHTATLLTSSLSSASGGASDYVLLRFPSEVQQNDFRYTILNGVNAMQPFNATDQSPVRGWLLSTTADGSGQATVGITDP
jgi:hypothetical protein